MQAIQKFRIERGVARTWLARELGISYTTLWRYEGRGVKVPKSVLFHAAHLLHVSPDKFHEAQ